MYSETYVVIKLGRVFRIAETNAYGDPRVKTFEVGTPLEISIPSGFFECRTIRVRITEDGKNRRSTRVSLDANPGDRPIQSLLPGKNPKGVRIWETFE